MTGNSGKSAAGYEVEGSTISLDRDLIVRPSDLLPGDVLLYRPRSPNFIQQKITSATGSPYTHAAIYLGDGLVVESNVPHGVGKRKLKDSIADCRCVAVLRSQLGFVGDRPWKLRRFVKAVLLRKRSYDFIAVLKFKHTSMAYFDNKLDFIRKNYGKMTSHRAFVERRYFCSVFVVACYAVVGIIGDTAQVAYQPDNFSPGHLHQDPAFGWLLGFLVPVGGSVPRDDPVLTGATSWRHCQDIRWW